MRAVRADGLHENGARSLHVPVEPLKERTRPSYDFVLVEWHDAWFDLDLPAIEERRADYLVRTVGFLVAEDPRFLSLAQEVLPEGEGYHAVTHIPVAIVERIQRLAPRTP